jgi:hypothetical protein
MTSQLTLTRALLRRLAVAKQQLAGPAPAADASGLMQVARALRCVQLDPISAVARSHVLVWFSRIGPYDPALIDRLLFHDKLLFEYWAHAASIVLMDDYRLHRYQMVHGLNDDQSEWAARARAWVETNTDLRAHILALLAERGTALSREIEADGIHPESWVSTGWTNGRNVSRMLDYLWMRGEIMVVGRRGGQKVWGLTRTFLPDLTLLQPLSRHEVVELGIEHAVRALGAARPAHIRYHFIRNRYHDLPQALKALVEQGRLVRAALLADDSTPLANDYFVHRDDLPLLAALEQGAFEPRTTLLSPFDNLICDRNRTRALWDFDFTIEIYVPPAKRQYGYYVLPILHGEHLIGRVDSQYDRKVKALYVRAVYAEPDVLEPELGVSVAGALESLGQFLGARALVMGERVPAHWAPALAGLR